MRLREMCRQLPDDWQDCCDWLGDRLISVLADCDPDLAELAPVLAARDAGDPAAAAAALLAALERPPKRERLRWAVVTAEREAISASNERTRQAALDFERLMRPPAVSTQRHPPADELLRGEVIVSGLAGSWRAGARGGIDWRDQGPVGDIEWAFAMNRHKFLNRLIDAWSRTGNLDYLTACDLLLGDWLLAEPTPAAHRHDAVWRELEVGLRLCGPWPLLFFATIGQPAVRPTTRLALLVAWHEQARYLHAYHGDHANHLLMELCGLAMTAVALPEFRQSADHLRYTAAQLAPQPAAQIYPDGAQIELSTHYHLVSLAYLDLAVLLLRDGGLTVPPELQEAVPRMWDYVAGVLRPDDTLPPTNDSDECQVAPLLRQAAEEHRRPDWRHAADGRIGSRFFPWAGQMVSRSDAPGLGHYGFFDVGPLGLSGHQHRDRLHLGIQAGGRDLLVDGGRYWYKWDTLRQYFLGTASHNCILINACGQADDGWEVTDHPFDGAQTSTERYDYCLGSFAGPWLGQLGACRHTRAVLYLRNLGWLVIDRIASDRPRPVWPLWHFHPACTVVTDGTTVRSDDPGVGNILVQPLGAMDWDLECQRGERNPHGGKYRMWKADIVHVPHDRQDQGWYAPAYHDLQPATCALYRGHASDALFGWLLWPDTGRPRAPAAHWEQLGPARCRVVLHDLVTVTVDCDGGLPQLTWAGAR
ncbi:MAG: heparinase II/III family protein [Planctomycetota bacterium]